MLRYVLGIAFIQIICGLVDLRNHKLTSSKDDHVKQSNQHTNKNALQPLITETELYLPRMVLPRTVGEEIVFELSNGQRCNGHIEEINWHGESTFVWSGSTQFDGSFHLGYSGGVIVGDLTFPNDGIKYQLRPKDLSSNVYTMKEIPRSVYDRDDSPEDTDPSLGFEGEAANLRRLRIHQLQAGIKLLADGDGGDTEPGGAPPQNNDTVEVVDTNNILDVMFIFTPQALASVGGSQSSMEALAALSVQLANEAYANSQLPIRMRCVSVAALKDTTYVETSFSVELNRLQTDKDGHFDEEVNLRTTVGADAVVLFVADTSYCGLAFMWATADMSISVVSTQCPHSVVHEVGHNIGCDHDRFTVHDYDYSHYNLGFCWDTSARTCSRSVMAYAGCVTPGKRTNCPRASYFSSPLIKVGSQHHTTGIATSDNARVIREQLSRAISWRKSKIPGGLITSVQPSGIAVGRCQPVLIKGFRIGTALSNITSVTLNGVPVQKILSQSLDAVEVLAGLSDVPGTGDIVVTTSSGYTTTLAGAFTYEATSGSFLTDFDAGLGTMWTSTGAADWSLLRYCDSLPCAVPPVSGPSVGVGGTGNFLKIQAYEASESEASLTATFNQDGAGGCSESVTSLSLYYHLWGPHSDLCGGSLVVTMQTVGSSAWTTILTATEVQARQDDPWLHLQYAFPNPTAVAAIRITAVPYSGQATCYYWGSVSVDEISVTKTTACSKDNCDYVSAAPTIALTAMPTRQPTTQRPSTPRPSTAAPSPVVRTPAPTSMVPVLEVVRFECTQTLTGLTVQKFLAEPADTARFLLAVASALRLPPEAVCCASMVDVGHRRRLGKGEEQVTSTVSGIRITYKVELRLKYAMSVTGHQNVSSLSHEGMHTLSAGALGAVDNAKQALTDSVSSGAFLTALKQVLSAEVVSADFGVSPVSSSSFSTPISELVAIDEEPEEPQGVTSRLSLVIGLGVLALMLSGGGCIYWKHQHKKAAAASESSDVTTAPTKSTNRSTPDDTEAAAAAVPTYRPLKSFSSDERIDNKFQPGVELTALTSASADDVGRLNGSRKGEGGILPSPGYSPRGLVPVPGQQLPSPRSRGSSWATPISAVRGLFSPRNRNGSNGYAAMPADDVEVHVPSADDYLTADGGNDDTTTQQPRPPSPGIQPRMVPRMLDMNGNVFAPPQLFLKIGDVSAPYMQPQRLPSPHGPLPSPTSRTSAASTPATATAAAAVLRGYGRHDGSLGTPQGEHFLQATNQTPRYNEDFHYQPQPQRTPQHHNPMQGYPPLHGQPSPLYAQQRTPHHQHHQQHRQNHQQQMLLQQQQAPRPSYHMPPIRENASPRGLDPRLSLSSHVSEGDIAGYYNNYSNPGTNFSSNGNSRASSLQGSPSRLSLTRPANVPFPTNLVIPTVGSGADPPGGLWDTGTSTPSLYNTSFGSAAAAGSPRFLGLPPPPAQPQVEPQVEPQMEPQAEPSQQQLSERPAAKLRKYEHNCGHSSLSSSNTSTPTHASLKAFASMHEPPGAAVLLRDQEK